MTTYSQYDNFYQLMNVLSKIPIDQETALFALTIAVAGLFAAGIATSIVNDDRRNIDLADSTHLRFSQSRFWGNGIYVRARRDNPLDDMPVGFYEIYSTRDSRYLSIIAFGLDGMNGARDFAAKGCNITADADTEGKHILALDGDPIRGTGACLEQSFNITNSERSHS